MSSQCPVLVVYSVGYYYYLLFYDLINYFTILYFIMTSAVVIVFHIIYVFFLHKIYYIKTWLICSVMLKYYNKICVRVNLIFLINILWFEICGIMLLNEAVLSQLVYPTITNNNNVCTKTSLLDQFQYVCQVKRQSINLGPSWFKWCWKYIVRTLKHRLYEYNVFNTYILIYEYNVYYVFILWSVTEVSELMIGRSRFLITWT